MNWEFNSDEGAVSVENAIEIGDTNPADTDDVTVTVVGEHVEGNVIKWIMRVTANVDMDRILLKPNSIDREYNGDISVKGLLDGEEHKIMADFIPTVKGINIGLNQVFAGDIYIIELGTTVTENSTNTYNMSVVVEHSNGSFEVTSEPVCIGESGNIYDTAPLVNPEKSANPSITNTAVETGDPLSTSLFAGLMAMSIVFGVVIFTRNKRKSI